MDDEGIIRSDRRKFYLATTTNFLKHKSALFTWMIAMDPRTVIALSRTRNP